MSGSSRPRVDPASFPSLGPGQLRPGREADAIDGLLPQAVLTARESAHVVDAITEARARKLGIVTGGGGTMLHIGAPPRDYDIKLSTTAIGRVVEQNPEDMTVTCEAGVSLSRLQRNLAKAGQRLAVDPALDERASIGGIVATGATGGLRYGYGTPRDLVLGMTAIDGCGREIHAGGRVVKNVAGYDLVRLLTGSFGTLAVITEVTLRTHPIPAAGATLVFEFVSASELDSARARLFEAALPLAALDFAVDASSATAIWVLVVRVEGTEEEVACQGDRVCAAVGRDPVDAGSEWMSPAHVDAEDGVTVKLGAQPSRIVGVVREVVTTLKGIGVPLLVGGHLGAGIARFHLAASGGGRGAGPESSTRPGDHEVDPRVAAAQASLATRLLAATEPSDTILNRVLERAPLSVKLKNAVWGPAPASLPLMRELKRRFDPDGVLSPGRFVGGL